MSHTVSEDANLEPRPHSFGPEEVDSLYLYVLFFSYFYFTKNCEPLINFCFSSLF